MSTVGEALADPWPLPGTFVQLHSSVPGEVGAFALVVKHEPGRVAFYLTKDGPVVGAGLRANRDANVVDMAAGLEDLVFPIPIDLRVIATKRALVKSRAGVWTANLCKTAKATDVSAQGDGPTYQPEVAIYSAWKTFEMRMARFLKKHGLAGLRFEPRLSINQKPLSAGRMNWSQQGYRRASAWRDEVTRKMDHRSIEEILASGKSLVEKKTTHGLLAPPS